MNKFPLLVKANQKLILKDKLQTSLCQSRIINRPKTYYKQNDIKIKENSPRIRKTSNRKLQLQISALKKPPTEGSQRRIAFSNHKSQNIQQKDMSEKHFQLSSIKKNLQTYLDQFFNFFNLNLHIRQDQQKVHRILKQVQHEGFELIRQMKMISTHQIVINSQTEIEQNIFHAFSIFCQPTKVVKEVDLTQQNELIQDKNIEILKLQNLIKVIQTEYENKNHAFKQFSRKVDEMEEKFRALQQKEQEIHSAANERLKNLVKTANFCNTLKQKIYKWSKSYNFKSIFYQTQAISSLKQEALSDLTKILDKIPQEQYQKLYKLIQQPFTKIVHRIQGMQLSQMNQLVDANDEKEDYIGNIKETIKEFNTSENQKKEIIETLKRQYLLLNSHTLFIYKQFLKKINEKKLENSEKQNKKDKNEKQEKSWKEVSNKIVSNMNASVNCKQRNIQLRFKTQKQIIGCKNQKAETVYKTEKQIAVSHTQKQIAPCTQKQKIPSVKLIKNDECIKSSKFIIKKCDKLARAKTVFMQFQQNDLSFLECKQPKVNKVQLIGNEGNLSNLQSLQKLKKCNQMSTNIYLASILFD